MYFSSVVSSPKISVLRCTVFQNVMCIFFLAIGKRKRIKSLKRGQPQYVRKLFDEIHLCGYVEEKSETDPTEDKIARLGEEIKQLRIECAELKGEIRRLKSDKVCKLKVCKNSAEQTKQS